MWVPSCGWYVGLCQLQKRTRSYLRKKIVIVIVKKTYPHRSMSDSSGQVLSKLVVFCSWHDFHVQPGRCAAVVWDAETYGWQWRSTESMSLQIVLVLHPLANSHIAMENDWYCLTGKHAISMARINSYVRLPEGNYIYIYHSEGYNHQMVLCIINIYS